MRFIEESCLLIRIVFGFVETIAADGDFKKNPFFFDNLSITNVCVKIASKSLPYSSPLTLNFKNIREAPNDISYEDYKNGNTIFAFDLTPDLCSAEHYNLLKDGSLDVDITMEKAFSESVTAYFYLEFDNIIEIDKDRRVFFDYKV